MSTQADLDAAVTQLKSLVVQLQNKVNNPPTVTPAEIDLTGVNSLITDLETVLNPPPPVETVTVTDANPSVEPTVPEVDSSIPAHLQAQQN